MGTGNLIKAPTISQYPTSAMASTIRQRPLPASSPPPVSAGANSASSLRGGESSGKNYGSNQSFIRKRKSYLIKALVFAIAIVTVVLFFQKYTSDEQPNRNSPNAAVKVKIRDPNEAAKVTPPGGHNDEAGHGRRVAAGGDFSVVQFVVTPYQQGQSYLPALGHARMELFKTFTLPSMVLNRDDGLAGGSPNGGFLWVIRTDPDLTDDLRDEMVGLLKPYPNFFLITSKERVLKLLNSWMNTSELDEMVANPERILSGDATLLTKTLRDIRGGYRDTHITETRLDSDDGINGKYLRTVRERIEANFGGDVTNKKMGVDRDGGALLPTWMYFCASSHMQWFSDEFPRSDYPSEKAAILSSLGRLEGDAKETGNPCITPGLTIVIRATTYGGDNEGGPTVPVGLKKHQRITYELKKTNKVGTEEEKKAIGCGLNKPTDCVVFLGKKPKINLSTAFKYDERFGIAAVRARALTSAGMKDIHTDGVDNKDEDVDGKTNTDKVSSTEKKRLWAQKDITLDLVEQHKIIRKHLKKEKKNWNMLESIFGVMPERIVKTRALFQHNLLAISTDALRGQCRLGHSCRKEAKEKIARVIAQLKEAGIGNQNMEGETEEQKDDDSVKGLVWSTDIAQQFVQKNK